MKRYLVALSAAAAAIALSTSLQAATLSFSDIHRFPTAAEITNGVPANARIHSFFVTTDSDILSVNQVNITHPSLYQNAFGTDNEPPSGAVVGFFPSAAADSWITTPGATAIAGTGGMNVPNSTWFDSTNNGAQFNFKFAQITTIGGPEALFTGRVSLAVPGGDPLPFAFSFVIPEPSTFVMGGMALVGAVAVRRRKTA